MARRAALLAACLWILSVSLCAGQDSSVFVIPERTPAPVFTLPDLNGRPVSSKDFAGKVAVLSFGATWCGSCTSELRSLERLQARFPNDVAVYFVALDGRGGKTSSRSWRRTASGCRRWWIPAWPSRGSMASARFRSRWSLTDWVLWLGARSGRARGTARRPWISSNRR